MTAGPKFAGLSVLWYGMAVIGQGLLRIFLPEEQVFAAAILVANGSFAAALVYAGADKYRRTRSTVAVLQKRTSGRASDGLAS